jgi:hypothetical protein
MERNIICIQFLFICFEMGILLKEFHMIKNISLKSSFCKSGTGAAKELDDF